MDTGQSEMNEIKKALYKEKPVAVFQSIEKGIVSYAAILNDNSIVRFEVPFKDMGETPFLLNMEARLLIRWIKPN